MTRCDPPPSAAPGGEGDYRTAVSRLEPAARNGVFIRAILDAGYTCQGVTGATEQPGSPGLWTATCDDGARYGVQIAANGTATVSGAVQR